MEKWLKVLNGEQIHHPIDNAVKAWCSCRTTTKRLVICAAAAAVADADTAGDCWLAAATATATTTATAPGAAAKAACLLAAYPYAFLCLLASSKQLLFLTILPLPFHIRWLTTSLHVFLPKLTQNFLRPLILCKCPSIQHSPPINTPIHSFIPINTHWQACHSHIRTPSVSTQFFTAYSMSSLRGKSLPLSRHKTRNHDVIYQKQCSLAMKLCPLCLVRLSLPRLALSITQTMPKNSPFHTTCCLARLQPQKFSLRKICKELIQSCIWN